MRPGARCQKHLDRPPRWAVAWQGDPHRADQRAGAARCRRVRTELGRDARHPGAAVGCRSESVPGAGGRPQRAGPGRPWGTTPFKAPEPVASPVSHGSQMGDYLLFLALIASLAGAPFGLARMLDAPTPGPWLLAF